VPTVAQCFTENLQSAVARSPLTQEQVARRAGIDRSQMTKLSKGVHIPRIDTMIRLEDALGLERAALVEGIAWTPAEDSNGEFSGSGSR